MHFIKSLPIPVLQLCFLFVFVVGCTQQSKSPVAENSTNRVNPEGWTTIKALPLDPAIEAQIDEINILSATYLAMEQAVSKLSIQPNMLLIDGNRFKSTKYQSFQTIVKGDSKSFSIAAASIIAKVTRDRMMKEYHAEFPEYGFDKHKGYGTKSHFAAIKKLGKCRIHRNSFLIKFDNREEGLFKYDGLVYDV